MFKELINALKAGNELRDPAKWKRGQQLTNMVGAAVAGILLLLRYNFPELQVPAELDQTIIELICAVLAVVNIYFVPATTKKIGV